MHYCIYYLSRMTIYEALIIENKKLNLQLVFNFITNSNSCLLNNIIHIQIQRIIVHTKFIACIKILLLCIFF